jgi:predicted HD phosphohydrolase
MTTRGDHDMARQTAQFSTMAEGTAEDWQIIGRQFKEYCGELHHRVFDHMRLLKGDYGGFPVDRLEHCLQAATMAHRDGRDEEYVVCALLHDIGDILCPWSHADIAAALLYPYVSERNHWMLKHHGVFQGYYFFHLIGRDRNMRDQFRDSPHFDYTAEFCHLYDQKAFRRDYDSEPLEFFEPAVKKVLETPRRSIYMS